eukprot:3870702-Rhodomonas_salina.2
MVSNKGALTLISDAVSDCARGRVVVPARLAKYVSRVGFAAGPWSEQIVAQSVGSESCALDSDGAFIVAARPRRLFTVRGSRVSRVNLVDLAGNERVKKSVPSGLRPESSLPGSV